MNRLTHKQALWAGLGILLLVNAIALGGAAWNRSAQDSRLQLSERELDTPYGYQMDSEDSGSWLSLDWRVVQLPPKASDAPYVFAYSSSRGDPDWLDARKLGSLGFDVGSAPSSDEKREWRQHERDVVLVLELNGPAYARDLAQVRDFAAKVPSKDNNKLLAERETQTSRLFAIDAGLDADALRRKYPDRAHYALVPATIGMHWNREKNGSWTAIGNLQGPKARQIHLSRAQATALASVLSKPHTYDEPDPTFNVELAFGRRLEPWVVSARVR
jgi:hypothetical protein